MSSSIHTDRAPAAIGPYSQAVRTENFVFTSGQISLDPETGALWGETIAQQTHRVCQNLEAILAAAGSSLKHVLKTVCYLRDMQDFAEFNRIYGQYFTGKPARSCVAVRELPKGALVEIEVIAEICGENSMQGCGKDGAR